MKKDANTCTLPAVWHYPENQAGIYPWTDGKARAEENDEAKW